MIALMLEVNEETKTVSVLSSGNVLIGSALPVNSKYLLSSGNVGYALPVNSKYLLSSGNVLLSSALPVNSKYPLSSGNVLFFSALPVNSTCLQSVVAIDIILH